MHANGLAADQLAVIADRPLTLSEVLRFGDYMLCTPGEALDLGLIWRPWAAIEFRRGARMHYAKQPHPAALAAMLNSGMAMAFLEHQSATCQ